jgi:Fe2+ transport system protein FeoA
MKVDKAGLKRRLMELGVSSNSKFELTKYRCGYTVKIRNATYAIDKSIIDIMKEIVSERR